MECDYRKGECKFPGIFDDADDENDLYFKTCQLCIMGKQADELSLLNSAIANLTASIEERLCREEQK